MCNPVATFLCLVLDLSNVGGAARNPKQACHSALPIDKKNSHGHIRQELPTEVAARNSQAFQGTSKQGGGPDSFPSLSVPASACPDREAGSHFGGRHSSSSGRIDNVDHCLWYSFESSDSFLCLLLAFVFHAQPPSLPRPLSLCLNTHKPGRLPVILHKKKDRSLMLRDLHYIHTYIHTAAAAAAAHTCMYCVHSTYASNAGQGLASMTTLCSEKLAAGRKKCPHGDDPPHFPHMQLPSYVRCNLYIPVFRNVTPLLVVTPEIW